MGRRTQALVNGELPTWEELIMARPKSSFVAFLVFSFVLFFSLGLAKAKPAFAGPPKLKGTPRTKADNDASGPGKARGLLGRARAV